MKRICSAILCIVLVLALAACGMAAGNQQQECSHDFYLSDYAAPSETENGRNEYTCKKCQFSYTEVIPATGVIVSSSPVSETAEPAEERAEPVEDEAKPAEEVPAMSAVSDWGAEAAKGQGIEVPEDFVPTFPEGKYVTVYSSDRDYGSYMKSRPESGTQYRLSKLKYPANVYLYGNYGSFTLIRTENGNYGFLSTSICNFAPISCDESKARRGEGLIERIENSGIVIPDGFALADVQVGELRNKTGSKTYAIYQYADPNDAGAKEKSFGKFYFPASSDARTANYDGRVEIYGSFNGYALMCSADGEFFWGNDSFFKAA